MLNLACEKDLVRPEILMVEGLNISAFLDHLEECPHCGKAERALVAALNSVIGGEKEY